ncbi:MAG: hypothetical protein L3J23_05995 [Flavobacteriaceae bacterium]|nr:hypothetical protein [Flavobacteriaceae bacterium]
MKKIILAVTIFSITFVMQAQNTFPSNGNVGVGTTNPLQKLHIHNSSSLSIMGISGIAPGILFSPNRSSSLSRAAIGLSTSGNHYFTSARSGDFNIRGGGGGRLLFGTLASSSSTNGNIRMAITNNGRVGIGITNPSSKLDVNGDARFRGAKTIVNGNLGVGTNNPNEKLTVKGTIHCQEVKVSLNVPADYVFEKYYTGKSSLKENYNMPTLEEVEAYTRANNHLPEMPSAKEIQKNGLHLKEMTNLLLQKIEELTLYTIEQEKRIKALEAKSTEIYSLKN